MEKQFEEALQKFLDDYLALCEKLHTNQQEKMLLDENSPYNVLKQAVTELEQIKGEFDENKKSDITGLSLNEFKEIHKNDTPIQALDILHRLSLAPDYIKPKSVEERARRFLRNKVEQALTGLSYTNPSKALICLNFLKDEAINDIACLKNSVTTKTLYQLYFANFDTIEQALTTKTKKEKAWDIVNNKEVNMIRFKAVVMLNGNANDYNKNEEYKERHLTDEEFELVKEAM